MAAVGISQTSSLATDTSKAKTATASVFAILDRKPKINSSDESGITLDRVKGEIEFRHVSFKYPTRPDVQIFQDLCLSIHAGKRFYDPDSGTITLDGTEIQNIQLKWLRQQMGLVSQEPVLFNETIRANIAYGKGDDATEDEIISAAKLANAHNFVSGLQESERMVQEALDQVMVNRTTIVIAHRLSTIKNADVIAVVKNGVIAEKGKHETLIQIKDGIYASLVALHISAST
ncbi:ABC transporter B family member 11 [Bienertia sinuspersici]